MWTENNITEEEDSNDDDSEFSFSDLNTLKNEITHKTKNII